MTCRRAQEFLARENVDLSKTEMVDAKKRTMSGKDALALAKQVDVIWATKGKSVVHLDLKKEKPAAGLLESLIIGPSGNLRAPTLRVGRTLLVGFDEETYRRALGA